MARSERMDPVDTTWLRLDRPTNRMTIVGLLMLAGPVDLARVERTLAERLLVFPRFRQRVETDLTGPSWCDDPDFDIAHHIKRVRLPAPGGRAELERLVADLAAQPLDELHPLWQYHIVEDYEGGVVLIDRLHHAIADGIALIAVMLSLTDEHPEGKPRHRKSTQPLLSDEEGLGFPPRAIREVAGKIIGKGMEISGEALRAWFDLATHPTRALSYLRDGVGVGSELAYILLMPTDSPTRFKGSPCGDKRVAWTDPYPLPDVKMVSHALGCSVNDMLLAAVAGALNGYLMDKGDDCAGVEVRALVPINLRPPGSVRELGNRFGVLAVLLPVGLENPLDRLFEVRRRMETLKQSYEPSTTLGLLLALGYMPQLVQDRLFDLLLSRASAVLSNVPGPQHPRYLAGAEIKQMMFWVPRPHDVGLGISILSYNGQVQFGLISDAAMVPDPQAVIARFVPEFEKLLYYVLLSAGTGEAAGPIPDVGGGKRPERRSAVKEPARRARIAR